nr:uncharacterized protein LOC128685404 [Cherax quadricarinatus]
MKLLILSCLLVIAVVAESPGYDLATPSGPAFSSGSGLAFGGSGFSGGSCGHGQIRHVDGSCVTPQITRNLYVFNAPQVPPIIGPRPYIPLPRLDHNIVFIRNPEPLPALEPIVVPPPQQKNVLYVLNKRPVHQQKVIQVPAPEQEIPQLYFVNYAEGDNPSLPTGGDLQSALSSAALGGSNLINSFGGGSLGGGSLGGVSLGGGSLSGVSLGGGSLGGVSLGGASLGAGSLGVGNLGGASWVVAAWVVLLAS